MNTQYGQSEELRFGFGKNWARYLELLDDNRIASAKHSLKKMLERESLEGLRLLDVGSGSGLFSLAARSLGARVHSFDYDSASVGCTQSLRDRYRPDDNAWQIEQGDALDEKYLAQLGQFDVVYSWGVLHHTGDMWQALNNVAPLVKRGGLLFLAIYNDQGRSSDYWKRIKKIYNKLPGSSRWLILAPAFLRLWGPTTARDIVRGKPFSTWRLYKSTRAMSPAVDVTDWVGGWPFEVAKPEDVFSFYKRRGFDLQTLKTCAGGHGCNEFVFRRIHEAH